MASGRRPKVRATHFVLPKPKNLLFFPLYYFAEDVSLRALSELVNVLRDELET